MNLLRPDRCVVVCEVGTSHNGRLDLALRLIEECAAAGADWIKLQCFTLAEIAHIRNASLKGEVPEPWKSMGYGTLESLYVKARTPHEWFPALVDTARQVGVPWFSSLVGMDSLALLEELGCPAYKLSAWDEDASWLYKAVRATGKPIVTSTRNPRPDAVYGDVVLYAPPGYPQDLAGLDQFATSSCDGLSYHGVDWRAPARAAHMGAKMVEVHVQLDDEPCEIDGHSSLTVSDLARLCEAVRIKEAA
jgi:sialic acid synthase SpsE